jgi:hypothetical protein
MKHLYEFTQINTKLRLAKCNGVQFYWAERSPLRLVMRSEVKQNGMGGNKLFRGVNAGEYGGSGALERKLVW